MTLKITKNARFFPAFRPSYTILTVLVCLLVLAPTSPATPVAPRRNDITELISPIKDLRVTVKVAKINAKELDKIGKDFGVVYRLRNLTMLYKSPDKIRLEGHSNALGEGLLILNGTRRYYNVPKFSLKKTEELKSLPSRRQSLLDFGLLSKETLRFMQADFEKEEMLDDTPTQVYMLTYRGQPSGSFFRVWIDPKTRIAVKREAFDINKVLKASFHCAKAKEISSGVWLPEQCEIRNAEGGVAAVLSYSDPQVDRDLADKLFDIAP